MFEFKIEFDVAELRHNLKSDFYVRPPVDFSRWFLNGRKASGRMEVVHLNRTQYGWHVHQIKSETKNNRFLLQILVHLLKIRNKRNGRYNIHNSIRDQNVLIIQPQLTDITFGTNTVFSVRINFIHFVHRLAPKSSKPKHRCGETGESDPFRWV